MAIIPKGQEPANVKKRIDTLFPKLNEAYPDKVIVSLQRDHKQWDETAREISKQLGYESKDAFLIAYGYTIEKSNGGRHSNDYTAIVDELKKRYPNGTTFEKMDELKADNPDLAIKFKGMSNKSNELFGMPLGDYFKSIGLLGGGNHKAQLEALISELKRRYSDGSVVPKSVEQLKADNSDLMMNRLVYIKEIFGVNIQEYLLSVGLVGGGYLCAIKVGDRGELMYVTSETKTIHVGDYVEISVCNDLTAYGMVVDTNVNQENTSKTPIEPIGVVLRKVGIREYNANMLKSVLAVKLANSTRALLKNTSKSKFVAIGYKEIHQIGKAPWACCRGLSLEILQVLDYLVKKERQAYEHGDIILISDEIAELHVFASDVCDVMKRFPNVKIAMFVEDANNGIASLAYSRSGYNYITDEYEVGKFDISKSRWTVKRTPIKSDFEVSGKQYVFMFADDWESLNYTYIDNMGQPFKLEK